MEQRRKFWSQSFCWRQVRYKKGTRRTSRSWVRVNSQWDWPRLLCLSRGNLTIEKKLFCLKLKSFFFDYRNGELVAWRMWRKMKIFIQRNEDIIDLLCSERALKSYWVCLAMLCILWEYIIISSGFLLSLFLILLTITRFFLFGVSEMEISVIGSEIIWEWAYDIS